MGVLAIVLISGAVMQSTEQAAWSVSLVDEMEPLASSFLGERVCSLRDLDGDGVRDLAVSSCNRSREIMRLGDVAPAESSVYIVSGRSLEVLRVVPCPSASRKDLFGWSLASDDDALAIGVPSYDPVAMPGFPGRGGIGRVRVHALDDFSLIADISSPTARDGFGHAVAFLEGTLLVGAPFRWGEIDEAGEPAAPPGAVEWFRTSDWSRVRVSSGSADGGYFGRALSTLPTPGLNGAPKLGVACLFDAWNGDDKGGLVVMDGTGVELGRLYAEKGESELGMCVDVLSTRDGAWRLLVGAPYNWCGGGRVILLRPGGIEREAAVVDVQAVGRNEAAPFGNHVFGGSGGGNDDEWGCFAVVSGPHDPGFGRGLLTIHRGDSGAVLVALVLPEDVGVGACVLSWTPEGGDLVVGGGGRLLKYRVEKSSGR